MPRMRRLVLLIVALAVLAVAADFTAARLFESRVAKVLGERYQIQGKPIVQVRDFPFLPHLISGKFGTVDVAGDDVRDRGVTVARLEVHLHDVHVPRSVMLGGSGEVSVGRADGQATIDQAVLSSLVADRLDGGSMQVGAGGISVTAHPRVLGRRVDATVKGRLTAAGGRLVFIPTDVTVAGLPGTLDRAARAQLLAQFSFPVPLPRLPAGIQVERVAAQPGSLTIDGQAEAIRVSS